jgi:hypothetical protein
MIPSSSRDVPALRNAMQEALATRGAAGFEPANRPRAEAAEARLWVAIDVYCVEREAQVLRTAIKRVYNFPILAASLRDELIAALRSLSPEAE